MDGVPLSRMETEWLVAWFYGRARLVPPHVQERLKILGFIDGVNLTDAGRRWLQATRFSKGCLAGCVSEVTHERSSSRRSRSGACAAPPFADHQATGESITGKTGFERPRAFIARKKATGLHPENGELVREYASAISTRTGVHVDRGEEQTSS